MCWILDMVGGIGWRTGMEGVGVEEVKGVGKEVEEEEEEEKQERGLVGERSVVKEDCD